MLGIFSLLSMFLVTVFIAGAVLRDSEVGMADMLFATPMRKWDYLFGRFAAGFVACLVIFAAIALATMLGPVMPWVDAQRVDAFRCTRMPGALPSSSSRTCSSSAPC